MANLKIFYNRNLPFYRQNPSHYKASVVIYNRRGFIRLATLADPAKKNFRFHFKPSMLGIFHNKKVKI